MKINFTIILTAISIFLNAQSDSLFVNTEIENEVYSIDFKTSNKKLIDFIVKNNIQIISQKETKNVIKIKFTLDQNKYLKYDSLVQILGYSSLKKVSSISNYQKHNEIQLELNYLRKKRDDFTELLSKLDEKTEKYLTIWNEHKIIEEKIFNKERELLNLNNKGSLYNVSIELNDETTSPQNTRVSFVNMPGIEYSYLNIETPKSGISPDYYQGFFLKYLFTRGKSFASIGVYKNNDISTTDTTAYSEIFLLGFGQDFYSRHLGRGSRKFLNLYSGYSTGILTASNNKNNLNTIYISPSIGLEIFKNKYFLIDSKINYFVPLSNNRNMRGISYNLAFNFVF